MEQALFVEARDTAQQRLATRLFIWKLMRAALSIAAIVIAALCCAAVLLIIDRAWLIRKFVAAAGDRIASSSHP